MTDKLIRVALVGFGHAGSVFHAPLIAATLGMRLSAIVTSNPERAGEARADYPQATVVSSADDIWRRAAEFDLAVIATPNRTHVELALAALEAGLAVVVDKPLAGSVEDAQRLVDAAGHARRLLTVFHNARWSIPFLTAQHLIAGGALGPIATFEAHLERYRPLPKAGAWRELGDPREAGGLLYDLGSHLIDQALVLFGSPMEVYAELEYRRPGTHVDDHTFVSLRFEGGTRAHLWMSYLARLPGPTLRLTGLSGSYVRMAPDPQEAALAAGLRPGDPHWGVEASQQWGHLSTDVNGLHFDGSLESARGGYDRFYRALAGALRGECPPPVDPQDAIETLRVIEAAQQCARTRVSVPLQALRHPPRERSASARTPSATRCCVD